MSEPVESAERTPDGLLLRYAAQFGFGLLTYLLIGMSIFIGTAGRYSGTPTTRFFAVPGVGFLASFLFAVFARVQWGWRGFLWGALLAGVIISTLATEFFVFVTIYLPPTK